MKHSDIESNKRIGRKYGSHFCDIPRTVLTFKENCALMLDPISHSKRLIKCVFRAVNV